MTIFCPSRCVKLEKKFVIERKVLNDVFIQ